jgi:beta-lactamase regulating signal transducer with metallopeptidase domain
MAEAMGLTWFDLGNAVWIATLAAGVGGVAVLLLRQRSTPAAHAVTVITSATLLLAPLLGCVGSRWFGVVPVAATPAIPTGSAQPETSHRRQVPPKPQVLQRQGEFPSVSSEGTPVEVEIATAPSRSGLHLLDLLLGAWIVGSMCTVLPLGGRIVSACRLRKSVRKATDPTVARILHQEAQVLRVKSPVVAESPVVCIPVALGPWRPLIVLPVDFSSQVSESVLASVLRHELGHLACRHHAATFLHTIARLVWWWHPLTWWQGRVQAELQEEIADNFALATAPCRHDYAALLLRLAEAAQAVPGPRVGLAMHQRQSGFARRIESLIRKERDLMTQVSRSNRWRLGIAAVAFLALLTCLTLRTPAATAQQKADGPPKQDPQKESSFRTESFRDGKALPEGKTVNTQEPGQPPVIVYPGSRSSNKWIETPQRVNVAIGEGVEWQGKTAYLGLTFELVIADTKTGKAIWSTNVGAFWDTITFVKVEKGKEAGKWAVALRSSANQGFQLTYDLETGRKLELTGGAAQPTGQAITPRRVWFGSGGIRAEKLYRLVGSAEEWTALRKELFGMQLKDIPTAADIDFSKEMLLVCYMGKAYNCGGIRPDLVVEDDERVLLRLFRSTYQTLGDRREEHPYGLVVLPRRPGKPHALEFDRQGLIGGPPLWKEFVRLTMSKAE